MKESIYVNFGLIKIICRACKKCESAEKKIKEALHELEIDNKVKYRYEITRSTNLSEAKQFSANISQTPFIVIDNQLVLAGRLRDVASTKNTLRDLMKNRGFRH